MPRLRPLFAAPVLTMLSMLMAGCGPEVHELESSSDGGPMVPVWSTQGGPGSVPPPAPVGCVDDVTAGQRQVKCDGLTHALTVPSQCVDGSRRCGLVVDVHGMTMDSEMQDRNTGMAALGQKHGYIVIQPDAPGTPPFSSWAPANDAKVHRLMLDVMQTFHVDDKRVHVTGFSQGGRMTWRFIDRYPELLASAAPAGHCFLDGMPATPLPLIHIIGSKDWLINSMCGKPGKLIDDELAPAWKLAGQTTVEEGADHRHLRYAGNDGVVVDLVIHDYAAKSLILGGHCFPGSGDLDGGLPGQLFGFGCTGDPPIRWGEMAMQFFIDHPKP